MIVTIHQPQYLPWLGYFDKMQKADIFVVLDDVQFKKNDWQNRNRIRTSQGWQWLTVPVCHDHGQPINEVKINNRAHWRKTHLNALKMNYGKTPFFGEYIDFFEEAYDRKWEYLVDINMHFIGQIMKWLGIETQVVRSSDYTIEGTSTERLINLCKECKATAYLSGVDGEKYMDTDQFGRNKIRLEIQDYRHPVYAQYWTGKNEDFVSHLSVIDLLFNCGPESGRIIAGQSI